MSYALFQVSIKGLIVKDKQILVLTTPNSYIDFPGGRINDGEQYLSHPDILKREINEELGPDITVEINKLIFITARSYEIEGYTNHVLALYYGVNFIDGDITISDEHGTFKWMSPQDLLKLPTENFMSSDEYLKLKEYINGNVI